MRFFIKFFFVFIFFSLILSLKSFNVFAADFKTDYQVEYNLSQSQDGLTSKVKFNVKITNLRSDVYVNKYSISFPRSFAINNLKIKDDSGEVVPKITSDDLNTKVEMEFTNPNIGKDSVNNFFLDFDQVNLFKVNGNVWEVAIPVIENKEEGSYQVVVVLPSNTDKKISISKPKPDLISGREIRWINPKTKTIYAVFGDSQIYQAELTYHIKNNEVFPVMTEVAFPPDSLYQKIFLESITPLPVSVYQDEDGNFLGRYQLKPLESKTIFFKGLIEVFSKPRDEAISNVRKLFKNQKDYLTSQQKFWKISSLKKIEEIKEVDDIYNFTVSNFNYNYGKIKENNLRLGAEGVLAKPDQAVCMEFTDFFIAVSREKGIFSREIEGYGFSYDPKLQPLSLASDVLHAWPEYYDEKKELWIPVDPTWENTSGIDYFTSFDLNHIVFAIHGKRSDYPLPAGMYKTDDSKDISIKASTIIPKEKKKIGIKNFNIPKEISDNKKYQEKFLIINNSNVYLYDIPVEIKGKNIDIYNKKVIIDSLAPYQEKEVVFNYKASNKNKKNKAFISIFVSDSKLIESSFDIIPYYYFVGLKVGGGIVLLIGFFYFLRKIKLRFKN